MHIKRKHERVPVSIIEDPKSPGSFLLSVGSITATNSLDLGLRLRHFSPHTKPLSLNHIISVEVPTEGGGIKSVSLRRFSDDTFDAAVEAIWRDVQEAIRPARVISCRYETSNGKPYWSVDVEGANQSILDKAATESDLLRSGHIMFRHVKLSNETIEGAHPGSSLCYQGEAVGTAGCFVTEDGGDIHYAVTAAHVYSAVPPPYEMQLKRAVEGVQAVPCRVVQGFQSVGDLDIGLVQMNGRVLCCFPRLNCR